MNNIKESIIYLLFGILTTLINIISYNFFTDMCAIHYLISNIIAWCISALFAFVTNKLYVFNSRDYHIIVVLKEFIAFIMARLVTGLLDMIIMYISVDIFSLDDFVTKLFSNVIVILLNYVFSKFIIFKRKDRVIKG